MRVLMIDADGRKNTVIDRRELFAFSVTVWLILAFCMLSFGQEYGDSYQYVRLIEVFRGDANWDQVRPPFAWRVIVPLLATPFSYLVGSNLYFDVMSAVALVGTIGWIIMLYLLLREFTDDYRLIDAVLIIMFLVTRIGKWLVVPLSDSWGMLFTTIALYLYKTGRSRRLIYPVIFVGIFARETVILALVFIFLHEQSTRLRFQDIAAGSWIVMPYLIFRYITLGNISQPISFNTVNIFMRTRATIDIFVLGGAIVGVLMIVGWTRGGLSDQTRRWMLAGILAFAPLVYLGLFHASFNVRFWFPLWLGFLPVAVSGDDSMR